MFRKSGEKQFSPGMYSCEQIKYFREFSPLLQFAYAFFFELCWKCLQQTCEIHTLCGVVCHAQFCLLQRQRDDIANMPLYFGNNFPHIPFHFPSFHLIQILICFCFCIFVLIFCCCLFALAAAIIRFRLNI